MQRLKLEGDVDTKFGQIETILRRMLRRVNSTVALAYLTNFGIHGFVSGPDADGILLKDMIPISGKITHAYLFVEEIPSDGGDRNKKAELTVAVSLGSVSGVSRSIVIREGMQEADMNLDVTGGARLTVSVDRTVKGLWYGIVISPNPVTTKVEHPAEILALEAAE